MRSRFSRMEFGDMVRSRQFTGDSRREESGEWPLEARGKRVTRRDSESTQRTQRAQSSQRGGQGRAIDQERIFPLVRVELRSSHGFSLRGIDRSANSALRWE